MEDQSLDPRRKITQEELRELFGDQIPMEVVSLIFSAPGEMLITDLRKEIRKLAEKYGMDYRLRHQFSVVLADNFFSSMAVESVVHIPKVKRVADQLVETVKKFLAEEERRKSSTRYSVDQISQSLVKKGEQP